MSGRRNYVLHLFMRVRPPANAGLHGVLNFNFKLYFNFDEILGLIYVCLASCISPKL